MLSHVNTGIGIISYNRANYLNTCLGSIYGHELNGAEVIVFDDHSKDGAYEVAQRFGKVVRPSENGGVIRNKNRALYYFTEISPKDNILIIEDDVCIEQSGWLDEWVSAIEKYGHINYSAPWFMHEKLKENFISGSGTASDPHIFTIVTGQVSGVKRSLIRDGAGYMNPKFVGFGYGHVEWTHRLISQNHGGEVDGSGVFKYLSIRGGINASASPTFRDEDQLARNRKVFGDLSAEGFGYKVKKPWLSDEEMDDHFIRPFVGCGDISNRINQKSDDLPVCRDDDISSVIMERPRLSFPDDVTSVVKSYYTHSSAIIEYGSGGSTVFAGDQEGVTVFSVESDRDWISMMRDWFQHAPPKGKVHLHHADIGVTKEWGYPKDQSRLLNYIDYPMGVWARPDLIPPDLVLIDGRFRVACFIATLMNITKPTTVLFDDYMDRPAYHIVEEILKPVRSVGRMAVFEATPRAFHPREWHRYGAYFFRPE